MAEGLTEPNTLSASAAVTAISQGRLNSEALVRACLERIEAREDGVQAWAHLDPRLALEQARERDRQPWRGRLHGIPIGIKDIIDTADMPTTYGSPIYHNHQPSRDASCVARARAQGAVILGKTRSTEFAAFHPATTANPHDLRHTPGGSSSGSAAAVADAMVPLAYGTQTAGSIIRPASYCGVVGFKPTFGVIDRSGVMLFADSLDTVGVFARSVEDAALLAGVVAGWDALAEAPAAATVRRVLVCRAPRWSQLAAEASAAVESALDVFGAAGATVQELVLPADFEALVEVQKTVQAFEGARALAYEVSAHQERLSPELLEMFAGVAKIGFEHFLDCLRTAASWRSRFDELVAEADCIVTASALGEAPRGLEATGDPLLNRIWTLLHMPAVTLPCGTGPQGLPVGVQLLGRRWGDAQLIGTARWLAERMKEDGAAKD